MDQLTPVVAAPPNGRPERQTTGADSEPATTNRVNRTWTWPAWPALVVPVLLLVAVGILAGRLLGATVALPLTGRQATAVIPFGDSAFLGVKWRN